MRMLTNPFVTGAKASAVFFRGARVSPLPPALPVATVPALGRRKRAPKQKAARRIPAAPLSAGKLAMIYHPPRTVHWGPDSSLSSTPTPRCLPKDPIPFAHRRLSIAASRCFVCEAPAMPGESCCYGCKSD